jgi:hypothetical protein
MQRGSRFRVGHTIAYDARQFGMKTRMHMEKAEKGWLIEAYDSAAEAQLGEQYIACKYGIPYTHWEIERGFQAPPTSAQRTTELIDRLYERFGNQELLENARRLLTAYGRCYEYPLIQADTQHEKFSRRVTAKIRACNLMPGIMQVPVAFAGYIGDETFRWADIEGVGCQHYTGTVYSLDVSRFAHYIADGIIVHNCLFGWKKKGKHQWYADRKQTTIWEFDRPKSNPDHPTMKPVELLAYPILNSSMANCIVLDPFGGSGSTLIACEQTDRICFMVELDERYCDVIVRRTVEQLNGSDDVFLIRNGERMPFKEIAENTDK